MLSTLVRTTFIFALAFRYVAADLQIDTPHLVQCQEAIVSFSGGQGPYTLFVVPSDEPCAESLIPFPKVTASPYKLKVNIRANTVVEFLVEDSTGTESWSGAITVQNSSDSSCFDTKSAQASNAPGLPAGIQTPSAISSPLSSPSIDTPTVIGSSSPSGIVKSVHTASPSGLANAGSGTNRAHVSGSIPRISLPASSLLGVIAFFAMVHF